jgi:purine-cytosine permease-like protein
MLALSVALTVACLRLPASPDPVTSAAGLGLARGLDVVLGYQVSWILMFADYTRYTRSERKSALAVFLGLGLTSLWLMPLGLIAARAAGTTDPGSMLRAVGLGVSGGLLMALGTVTTNFVNIYLSALAWRSLVPRTRESVSLWVVGVVGSLLSLLSRAWLERFADFMLLLGGVFTPVGGALLARFFLVRRPVVVDWLYDARGPLSRHRGFAVPGVLAWAVGAVLYYFPPGDLGGTLPALAGSALAYWLVEKLTAGSA